MARLGAAGFRVLACRFACRRGDVDVVCRRGDAIVFVEVKTRSSASFGTGEEALTESKLRNLASCAREYRAMTGWRGPIRFLLATVRLGYGDGEGTVELDDLVIA